jgi:hypothetical protein
MRGTSRALAGLEEKSDLIRFNTFFPSPSKPHTRHPQIKPRQRSIVARLKLVERLDPCSCARATHAQKNDGDLSALAKRLHPHYFFVLPIAA